MAPLITAKTAASFDLKSAATTNQWIGLWRTMSGYRRQYMGAALTLGIAAMSRTATFLLLAYVIDHVLGSGRIDILAPIALAFLVLASFEGAFSFLSGKLAALTAEGLAVRLRNYFFDHVQYLSFTYHDQNQTGDLVQRSTSDIDAVRRFFLDQAIGLGRIILLFVINFIAVLALNWQLALKSVVVVPVIIWLSTFFFKRISKAYEAFQEQDAVLSTILQENLTGVRVVKAFARQSYERDKFQEQNWKRLRLGNKQLMMHSVFWPLADSICGFQMIAGYYIAATMVLNGEISLGTYLAYVGLLTWLIWPMRNLGRLIVQMSTGLVSFGRLMEVIKEDREPLMEGNYQPASHVRGEVVFDDVSFAYDKAAPALHNISFRAEPGQSIALVGSTGSGKTTLVNLLPRFYEYTSGSLMLDGIDLRDYPRDYLRRQIGIVEQQPFLFSRTIRENITYGLGRSVSDDEVIAAARAAAIHDVVMSFPDGYSTLVGEKGVTLSGGQKQRIAVARTLLKDPRILVLDDATSSVDTETEADIRDALETLMKGRTTFIIAHRIHSVMNANLILVLDKGRIVQRGTHDQLLDEPGIYRQIYDVQSRIEVELEKELASV